MSELSLGEKRVRTTFNPSSDSFVDEIKQKTAELINLTNELGQKPFITEAEFGDFKRLQALAMTAYEEAAMWAVKAATC